MKFDELSSLPSASEIIGFWRSLHVNIFHKCETLPRVMLVSSELSSNASMVVISFRQIIKNKVRLRPSDSNLNCLLHSVMNLTPNITGLVKAESKVTLKSFMFILPVYKIILFKLLTVFIYYNCDTCGIPETVEHFVMHCSKNTEAWHTPWWSIQRLDINSDWITLLKNTITIPFIIAFLQQTGRTL